MHIYQINIFCGICLGINTYIVIEFLCYLWYLYFLRPTSLLWYLNGFIFVKLAEILQVTFLTVSIISHKFLLNALDSFQDLKKLYLTFLLVTIIFKFA